MVARYDIDGGYVQAVEGGSWVDFEEHQREVAQLQARVAELEGALRVSAEYIIKLESFATESGAEAYDIACEEMEAWQEKRRKAGKEIGTQGSLVDGIGWLYERLDELEALRA